MNGFPVCEEELTEGEKELFITDLKVVLGEYFEGADRCSVDVTETENGISVCVIFDAVRIKKFRKAR